MLIRRNIFLRAFKVVIQMSKVKRLDINQFHNIKTSKKLAKMKMMAFQVTPNSKIKCKKRNSKTTISLVNLYGANTTKSNLLKLLPNFINKKTKT
jgi:hypothetical protein